MPDTANLEALLEMVTAAKARIGQDMAARALTRYERERVDYVTDMLADLISATEDAIGEVRFYGERA